MRQCLSLIGSIPCSGPLVPSSAHRAGGGSKLNKLLVEEDLQRSWNIRKVKTSWLPVHCLPFALTSPGVANSIHIVTAVDCRPRRRNHLLAAVVLIPCMHVNDQCERVLPRRSFHKEAQPMDAVMVETYRSCCFFSNATQPSNS